VTTVAAIQCDIAWEDRAANLTALAPQVAAAVDAGAGVVLLPEMFAVGFSMATHRTAEAPDGPTTAWLLGQAAGTGAWVGGSVPVRRTGADRPRNTFVLAGPGGELHRYDKRHPFSYAGELEHFEAGDDVVTVDVAGLRLSLAVCYDLRFADQFWHQAEATDCYAVVANWPRPRAHHWRALLLARAIENQAYVVGVNRVGVDGSGLDHAGGSLVVGPMGEVLADAGEAAGTIAADLDPGEVAAVRSRFPFLPDRR
jgi:predicted amidohydrolase